MMIPLYGQDVGTGVFVEVIDKPINWGLRAGGSLLIGGIPSGASGLGIHGNSMNSPKPQHVYKIYNSKNGTILEVGASGQDLNQYGTSPRVAQKLRTKYPNDPDVSGRVTVKNVNGRDKILKWEKNKVQALKKNGLKLLKQFKP